MEIFDYDEAVRNEGYTILCGVDEAGRGPLAGPVFAAAVVFTQGVEIEGLNDSKKLSEKKREALFDVIIEHAEDYCVASASVDEVEKLNILQATFLAMTRAVAGLKVNPGLVLVDGNRTPPAITQPVHTVIKGDSLSASIAAASVLAKVSRDRLMVEMDREYPQYCFAKHKGYGTALHVEMIQKYGPSPIHRRSFLKNIL